MRTERDFSPDMVEIRRERFDNLIGQPAYFYAEDVMTSPFGDKKDVPIADYLRTQSDGAERGLFVHGIVEGIVRAYTPQYFRDPTEEVWLVHLRHTEVSDEGGQHLELVKGAPRAYVRIDRIYGWYDSRETDLPAEQAIAA